MKNSFVLCSLMVCGLFTACEDSSQLSNNASYITLLGNDTLGVEKFEKTEHGISAKVALRSPETTLTSYVLTKSISGGIEELIIKTHDLDKGFSKEGTIERSYKKDGDSLVVSVKGDDGSFRIINLEYEAGVLPFIDMVHWPFEVAFNNAMKTDADSVDQRLLTGSRTSNFIIAKIKTDSMTIRHPSRGVMGVNVDENGNIMELDAAETTRKLTVKRVADIDINAIASSFAKLDKKGNPFGILSGAVEGSFIVQGADIDISYGSPQKRGRKLFGGIVPFGELWRTGANSATHFKTSRELKIQDLIIPAGEYTLFSIPEADGGTLIINKQTGQNGQTYSKARDLGRVKMTVSEQSESVEGFTIVAEEKSEKGELKLMWGTTIYSVNFEVK